MEKLDNGKQWYIVCRRCGDVRQPLNNGLVQAKSKEGAIMQAVCQDFKKLHRLQLKGQLLAIPAGNCLAKAVQKRDHLAVEAE